MRRWPTGSVVILALLLSLSACDPYPPASTNSVSLNTELRADGSATTQMFLDDADRSPSQVKAWGEEVGSRLFPDASSLRVRVDDNGGGFPFAVIEAAGVYRPGPQPRVTVDTREAVRWLVDHGARSVDVSADAPRMPATGSWAVPPQPQDVPGSWSWTRITDATRAPSGTVVLSPEPWRGAASLLTATVAVALLVASVVVFRRRGRRPAIVLAVATVAVLALESAPALDVRVDDLAVAGLLAPPWSGLASGFVTAALLLVPVALVLVPVFAVLGAPRRTWVFVPPPGWPSAPAGWLPPPGWQPDPAWPPAPQGWQLVRVQRDGDPVVTPDAPRRGDG